MGRMSESCLSLGPGVTGSVLRGGGGRIWRLQWKKLQARVAQSWLQVGAQQMGAGRWGLTHCTGRTGVGHQAGKDHGWQGRKPTTELPLGFAVTVTGTVSSVEEGREGWCLLLLRVKGVTLRPGGVGRRGKK